ncbi:unnamed protein product [Amoebophrya sp. A25]|nr:unnamed protein product [Amoebophrya sp. A25]|eukprot:GSA25T00001618001.1
MDRSLPKNANAGEVEDEILASLDDVEDEPAVPLEGAQGYEVVEEDDVEAEEVPHKKSSSSSADGEEEPDAGRGDQAFYSKNIPTMIKNISKSFRASTEESAYAEDEPPGVDGVHENLLTSSSRSSMSKKSKSSSSSSAHFRSEHQVDGDVTPPLGSERRQPTLHGSSIFYPEQVEEQTVRGGRLWKSTRGSGFQFYSEQSTVCVRDHHEDGSAATGRTRHGTSSSWSWRGACLEGQEDEDDMKANQKNVDKMQHDELHAHAHHGHDRNNPSSSISSSNTFFVSKNRRATAATRTRNRTRSFDIAVTRPLQPGPGLSHIHPTADSAAGGTAAARHDPHEEDSLILKSPPAQVSSVSSGGGLKLNNTYGQKASHCQEGATPRLVEMDSIYQEARQEATPRLVEHFFSASSSSSSKQTHKSTSSRSSSKMTTSNYAGNSSSNSKSSRSADVAATSSSSSSNSSSSCSSSRPSRTTSKTNSSIATSKPTRTLTPTQAATISTSSSSTSTARETESAASSTSRTLTQQGTAAQHPLSPSNMVFTRGRNRGSGGRRSKLLLDLAGASRERPTRRR